MSRSSQRSSKKKDPKQESSDIKEPMAKSSLYHSFTSKETKKLRERLLAWYDVHKRHLPWRTLASTELDFNRRAYAVWVSEVMLQQTQVATVIEYYNKWMKAWPSLEDLASASLEEVNEKWSGLGYYSRGRRLHEGAQKLVSELGGTMPRSAEELQKLLPGVTGVVDGNVIRVLSRLRCIGADSSTPVVMERLWDLANNVVDPERPGDFNQAVMELGATVCTPKKPLCTKCPLQENCRAYKKVNTESTFKTLPKTRAVPKVDDVDDIEECDLAHGSCNLCIPLSECWESSLGVTNFPRKSAKKPSRVEQTVTCVCKRSGAQGGLEYLIVQRPSSGLLAGMWEFPNLLLGKELTVKDREDSLGQHLQEITGLNVSLQKLQYKGEVVHIFSHIHQTYIVYILHLNRSRSFSVKEEDKDIPSVRWVTKEQFMTSAIPTAMKKIMKLCEGKNEGSSNIAQSRKRKKTDIQPPSIKIKTDTEKQSSIRNFFKPAIK
ncbi:hypothetical protein GDO86_007926 [Hymenochirus boettgeri]|uniref:Adenine DNA glycosylase n=1 Tax=Hymenochirus boettgeri TaxID=247094 RepID=A0A8T2IVR0_9PIPI|nr:hypothetical protein GDO86_007926 [Hymenochirus boettgeri]